MHILTSLPQFTLPVKDVPTLVPLLTLVLILQLLSLPKLLHGLLSCSCSHKLLKVTLMQPLLCLLIVSPVVSCIRTFRTTSSISHLLQPLEKSTVTKLLPGLTENALFDDYTYVYLLFHQNGKVLVLLIQLTFLP